MGSRIYNPRTLASVRALAAGITAALDAAAAVSVPQAPAQAVPAPKAGKAKRRRKVKRKAA